jgi:membrane protein
MDTYSAAAAFYIFMSFIPYLLIFMSTIKYLPFTKPDLMSFMDDLIPGDPYGIIDWILDEMYARGLGTLSISIIAAVWASAKGVFGITKGLDEIFDIKEKYGFWYLRTKSAFCTLLLMIGMILMLVISVFGNMIINIVSRHVTISNTVLNILAAKNFIMFCILFIVFLFFFCVLPGQKIKASSQIIGAALASLVWILFTKLFSFYLSTFNGYSMYGSFAVILIIGVWIYTGMYIMFMGAMLNKVIASRKGNNYERKDQ